MTAFLNTEFKHRARIAFVAILLLLPLLEVSRRLALLQLQENEEFKTFAEVQGEVFVPLSPLRGTITDRNGAPLAQSFRENSVFAETRELADVDVVSASLAPFVGLSADEIEARIRTTWKGSVVPVEGINESEKAEIAGRELGGVSFRVNEGGYDVVVDLAEVSNIRDVAFGIGRALHRRATVYEAKIRDQAKGHVLLAKGLSNEKRREIAMLGLPGITFETTSRRVYPKGPLAAHVLGFVGANDKGLEGVERAEDPRLRGIEGFFVGQRDRNGRRILSDDYTLFLPNGPDVVLTIDEYLQTVAEDLLAARCIETQARTGTLIAMDPHNGEIMAMASYPSYDPNEFGRYNGQYLNRSVAAVYEPGSVMKPITMALALDKGVVQPETIIFCENGSYRIGGKIIGDDKHNFANLTCSQIISRSSNIGITKVAQMMGEGYFCAGMQLFGYGARTGIDLPGEVPGLFTPCGAWSGSHIATVSYGQGGNSTTPIQVARGYCALANGGYLVTPHVVRADRHPVNGELHYREYPKSERIFSETAFNQIRQMMIETTEEEHGTGGNARVPGYRVAGKTGTARVPSTTGPGYEWGERVASFAGYLPAEDPRVMILVVIDRPERGLYGSMLAAPVFSQFGERAMRYLGVPRSATAEAELLAKLPPLTGASMLREPAPGELNNLPAAEEAIAAAIAAASAAVDAQAVIIADASASATNTASQAGPAVARVEPANESVVIRNKTERKAPEKKAPAKSKEKVASVKTEKQTGTPSASESRIIVVLDDTESAPAAPSRNRPAKVELTDDQLSRMLDSARVTPLRETNNTQRSRS